MTEKPEALLTVEDVARELNVKESWVYTKAEAGELPSFKLGRYRRFKRSEVLAWLESQRQCGNGSAR